MSKVTATEIKAAIAWAEASKDPELAKYEPIAIYIKNADAKRLMKRMFRDQLWFKCFFPAGLCMEHRCMMWVRTDTDLTGFDYQLEEDSKYLYPR